MDTRKNSTSVKPFTVPSYEKHLLKCPVCGLNVVHRQFVRGALGHAVQALTCFTWPRAGSTWTRRPMNLQELGLVARALAKAVEVVSQLADYDSIPDPVRVLAEVESDVEMEDLAMGWINEATEELARRERLVEDELRRRAEARGDI